VKLWGRGEIHTEFRGGSLNERTSLENFGIDDRISHFCKKQWKVCCTVEIYPFVYFISRRAIKHNVLGYNWVSFFRYWK